MALVIVVFAFVEAVLVFAHSAALALVKHIEPDEIAAVRGNGYPCAMPMNSGLVFCVACQSLALVFT